MVSENTGVSEIYMTILKQHISSTFRYAKWQ
jgi:hypothetical protein